MPYKVPGIPGKFYRAGERKDNRAILWRFSLPDGRRPEYSTGTTDSQTATRFALGWLDANGGRVPDAPVTFAAAVEAYKAWKSPRKDDRKWLDRLALRFSDRGVDDIVHADLVGAANELLPTASNAHKNRCIMDIGGRVLHYAHKQRWCAYQKIERFWVSRKSPRQPASDATIALLRANTKSYERALLGVLYETGLRITAAVTLLRNQVDLQERRILSPLSKTDDAIWLPISTELMVELANIKACRRGKLFPWTDRHQVYDWLSPLTKKLKVHYTPHLSRHAMATDMQRRRIPDKQAAANGAWADPRSLQRYQAVIPEPIPGRTIAGLAPAPATTPARPRSRKRTA